ncbi:MAG: hypothetical protein ABIE74_05165 [Pseudomonadota bacterium]
MVYDIKFHNFEDPIIAKYSVFPTSRTPETLEQQIDILSKWNNEKEKMHNRTKWSVEDLNKLKIQQLSVLVDHAFNNVVFYHELYKKFGFQAGEIRSWKGFGSLPVINKIDLANNFPDRIVAKGYVHNKLHGARTSGSNGMPVTIVSDWNRVAQDTIDRMRMFEIMMSSSIDENDWRYCIDYSPWWISSFVGKYRSYTVHLNCPIDKIVEHIRKLKPTVVCGVGNMIIEIASRLPDAKQLGIKCFSSNSETTSIDQRRKISSDIGVPILDEYSSEELGLIATECNYGAYHVVEDSCHVELLSLEDNSETKTDDLGRIIGTGMWNMAMPIIRYDQGDLAEWSTSGEKCACNQTFRRFKCFHGRSDQALFSPVYGLVPPIKILAIMDNTLACTDSGFLCFRLIQKAFDTLELYVVVENDKRELNMKLFEKFKTDINALFKYNMTIKNLFVDELPPGNSYKRKTIVNEIPKNSLKERCLTK